MLRILAQKLGDQLTNPIGFYDGIRYEDWKPAFVFFLWVTLIISIVTPPLNYFGIASTDFTSSIGGRGSVLDAFKITCYGVGPCLLDGFLPYVSLFAGYYSFAMQFYIGPKTLYKVREGRAIVVFVAFIALSFIEMFVLGKTAGL